jgi:hypothetical protein
MAENVILLVRPGPVHWQRQAAACQPYLDEHDYALVGKAETAADAFRMVFNKIAQVVVAAGPDAEDWRLERLLAEADPPGRLEICRTNGRRHEPAPLGHHTDEIVTRMANHGGTTGEIVRLLGIAEERVRAVIDRVRGRR